MLCMYRVFLMNLSYANITNYKKFFKYYNLYLIFFSRFQSVKSSTNFKTKSEFKNLGFWFCYHEKLVITNVPTNQLNTGI